MDFGIRGRVAWIRGEVIGMEGSWTREAEEFLERRSNCKNLGNPGRGVMELELF
jgi:hypothetical protein